MRTGAAGRRGTRPESGEVREDAGTELFCELARMVAALAEVQGLRSFTLPYPGFAQRALDRTVTRCLDIGEAPPKSLPELWEWCRTRTAHDRLFGVPASFVTPDVTLVHPVGLMPTRTCLEVASHGSAGGVVTEARTLLDDLAARCGSTERYRRSRQFLARHPVVHQEDRRTLGWNKAVWSRVKELYRPIPEFLIADDVFRRCPACGLPALPHGRPVPVPGRPVGDEEIWCEGEECARPTGLELIRDPDHALLLRRALRAFLVLPQRAEAATLDALDRAGIEYEAVPERLCAYRLRGTGSETLDVEVHDRLQPSLLAVHLTNSAPFADRTLIVVPQRLADRDGYRADFSAALPAVLRERIVLTTPMSVVHHIGTPLADGGGRAHPATANRLRDEE
ncbi:pPIWI_RE_Y domain-containing protein [Streptomyces sp. NPDC055037]